MYTSMRHWNHRKFILLSEILSYDASIICLQDFDHLADFWQPKLSKYGYDICHFQRTRFQETTNKEFVGIAYKSSQFQLFRSVHIELNKCTDDLRHCSTSFRDKCKTDDVGLLAFLQPWGDNHIGTAFCVATAMCSRRDVDIDVRCEQVSYFCRILEAENSHYRLPVIMGISLHDVPSSGAYHILRTGRTPLEPKAPKKCPTPRVERLCRGSVALYWHAPAISVADPPILAYRIAWCPGGSKALGYKAHILVSSGDCVQYQDLPDKNGQLRSTALAELRYVVSGLSSELPYEFRVSAINKVGEGEPGDPTHPLLLINPPKAPRMPPLLTLRNKEQIMEARECSTMELEDWNALVRCFIPHLMCCEERCRKAVVMGSSKLSSRRERWKDWSICKSRKDAVCFRDTLTHARVGGMGITKGKGAGRCRRS